MDSNFQFLVASPSEGDGTQFSKMRADLSRNRRFESISLQRRVTCEPDLLDQIRKFVKCSGAIMLGCRRDLEPCSP